MQNFGNSLTVTVNVVENGFVVTYPSKRKLKREGFLSRTSHIPVDPTLLTEDVYIIDTRTVVVSSIDEILTILNHVKSLYDSEKK